MPISKRRKSDTRKRALLKAAVERKSTRWSLRLSASRFAFIKNDPDFLTMIKIGRAHNALAFASTCMIHCQAQETITEIRHLRRANFILAGYLHEAIKVVLAVKGRYLGDPAFERLRLLALGKEYGKARYYVRKIRNCAAFHLDENDAVTRRTLAKLKPTSMRFACGDDLNQLDVYYEFTDLIDYEFIYNEVSRGRTRQETNDDLSKTIRNFADEFMDAANTFQEALADKFELKNYVY